MKTNSVKMLMALSIIILSGLTYSGSIIWHDNFDTYGSDDPENQSILGDEIAWITGWNLDYRMIRTGGTWGTKKYPDAYPELDYRAFYYNSYWGEDFWGIALANGVDPSGDPPVNQSDYAIKVECTETHHDDWTRLHDPYAHMIEWSIVGRVSTLPTENPSYIRLGTVWGGYMWNLYAVLEDTAGGGYRDSNGDLIWVWVGADDPNLPDSMVGPITLELDMQGSHITGRVTYNGHSVTLGYTTTLTEPGGPGFTGRNLWGYAVGCFDNFEVLDSIDIDFGPDTCGEEGTVYKYADLNQDCYVNLLDFALFASDWMACTNPAYTACDAYWKQLNRIMKVYC